MRCAEVESFDDELAELVRDMTETMHRAPGIGLAASQVGVEKRVALVDLSVGEDPEALLVMINPEIVDSSGATLMATQVMDYIAARGAVAPAVEGRIATRP